MKKVNEIFPFWIESGGVFKAISEITEYTAPWISSTDNLSLDLQYHGNHSGNKYISPLIENLISESIADIPEKIAKICIKIYGENWRKLWESYSIDYKPLENFEITEELMATEDTTENSDSDNNISYGKIISRDTTTENSTDNAVYAFNSSSENPSDKTTDTGAVNSGENTTGTDTSTATTTGTSTAIKEHTINRHGNTGTTKQELLSRELEIRQWQFFDIVFKNIDTILTIKIY